MHCSYPSEERKQIMGEINNSIQEFYIPHLCFLKVESASVQGALTLHSHFIDWLKKKSRQWSQRSNSSQECIEGKIAASYVVYKTEFHIFKCSNKTFKRTGTIRMNLEFYGVVVWIYWVMESPTLRRCGVVPWNGIQDCEPVTLKFCSAGSLGDPKDCPFPPALWVECRSHSKPTVWPC